MSENKSSDTEIMYLTLVALVAIVGMVALTGGGTTAPRSSYELELPAWDDSDLSSDSNMIGNAVGGVWTQGVPSVTGFNQIGTMFSIMIDDKTSCFNYDGNTNYIGRTFNDPIIVMSPASFKGGDPAHPRLMYFDENTFCAKMEEWDYLDGIHLKENVSVMVVERGTWNVPGFPDSKVLHANRMLAGKSWVTHGYDPATHAKLYNESPIVLDTVAPTKGTWVNGSNLNESFKVVARLRNIGHSNYQVRLQLEEQYNAWSIPTGAVNVIAFEQGYMKRYGTFSQPWNSPQAYLNASLPSPKVNHQWKMFSHLPGIPFASMQTYAGSDPANLRRKHFQSGVSIKFIVHEEQSANAEMGHNPEQIGLVVVGR